jgi:Zn-dependent protease with chaperone function
MKEAIAVICLFFITSLILFPFVFSSPSAAGLLLLFGLVFALVGAYLVAPLAFRGSASELRDSQVNAVVEDLSASAGLSTAPKVYVIETPEINASAYESVHGHRIAFTSGLLGAFSSGGLTEEEFRAITAHEMGHLKERHMAQSALATSWVTIAGALGMILFPLGWAVMVSSGSAKDSDARVGLIVIGAVLAFLGFAIKTFSKAVSILTFLFDRHLELRADTLATLTLGTREPLISALEKIERHNSELNQEVPQLPDYDRWQIKPKRSSWLDHLFDTHPSLDKRVENLRQFTVVSPKAGYGPYPGAI